MPYQLVKRPTSGQYAVKTMTTGRLHGWTTKSKAEAQLRILNALKK